LILTTWVAKEKLEVLNLTDLKAKVEVDCIGVFCPMPISMTKDGLENIQVGEILKVEADDPAAEEDIKCWAKRTGHKILKFEKEGTILTFFIKKMK